MAQARARGRRRSLRPLWEAPAKAVKCLPPTGFLLYRGDPRIGSALASDAALNILREYWPEVLRKAARKRVTAQIAPAPLTPGALPPPLSLDFSATWVRKS